MADLTLRAVEVLRNMQLAYANGSVTGSRIALEVIDEHRQLAEQRLAAARIEAER